MREETVTQDTPVFPAVKKWISAMNEHGISYVAWNLSNKAETSAILKSDCSKVS